MLCVECLNERNHTEVSPGRILTTVQPGPYLFRGVSYCEQHATDAINNEHERYSALMKETA